MVDAAKFRALVSGRRRGLGATLARGVLSLAEPFYWVVMHFRNRRYDTHDEAVHRVEVPVVSVGNLTVGGTGKTPMVEWLSRWFRSHNVRVALISRGYGAEHGSRNDEAIELERKLPDVPHLQDPDRIAAARVAIDELDTELIVLDDAFQHRRIGRDLDIVLVDATEPFGFDHLLPRGLLREPLSSLCRADAIVLTRCDMVDEPRRKEIREQVHEHGPNAIWLEAVHQARCLLAADGSEESLGSLPDSRVAAFCGIGNPDAFRRTLSGCGCEVVELREFPDHHIYQREDVEQLIEWSNTLDGVAQIICTHKDLVKLAIDSLGDMPLRALVVSLELTTGKHQLEKHLLRLRAAAHDENI